jgi:tRNA-splicing ligase RtcB
MDAMLAGGARWAVEQGYGAAADLERIEERGCMPGARPDDVSAHAKNRQRDEMGTLGSGNHYLEVQQQKTPIPVASAFHLREGVIASTGSCGLGHQIGTEFLKRWLSAPTSDRPPDRELACAPIDSPLDRIPRRDAGRHQLRPG